MTTVVDAIVDSSGRGGTLTVLGADGEAVTSASWAVLHDRARRMAAVMARRGVGPHTRIGLLGDTSAELVAALQAGWLAGASITVLPPPTRLGQRSYLDHLMAVVTDADLTVVVVDDSLAAVGAALPRVLPLATLVAEADLATPLEPVRPDPDALAILQYTSGSTRTPRGVPVTHRNLAANVAAINAAIDHGPDRPGRWLSWLPLYHDMGLIGFFTVPMAAGSPLVLQSPVAFARRPAGWLEAMSQYRITASGAPNFAYGLMTRLLRAGLHADLRSVRFLLSGGEPIDGALMARFAAAAIQCGLNPDALSPAYGLAESTLAVAITPPGRGVAVDRIDPDALAMMGQAVPARPGGPVRELVKVGPPVPSTEVRIVDTVTGVVLDSRRVGHIEVRGPSVVGHYWGDPPATSDWLRTGDLGYLADGEVVVCGREKDVLFAAGRNVYPHDIEAAVSELPGVRAGGVAAFGLPDERVVLAVETSEPDSTTLPHLVTAAVRDEVGLTPADVVLLAPGQLPKTSSGKLRRAETCRRYLAGELTEPRVHERTAQ